MKNKLRRLNKAAWLPLMAGTPVWAAGGGRLVATQAIAGLSSEVSGPLAYGLALVAVVGSAIAWYRNHHDAGALQTAPDGRPDGQRGGVGGHVSAGLYPRRRGRADLREASHGGADPRAIVRTHPAIGQPSAFTGRMRADRDHAGAGALHRNRLFSADPVRYRRRHGAVSRLAPDPSGDGE